MFDYKNLKEYGVKIFKLDYFTKINSCNIKIGYETSLRITDVYRISYSRIKLFQESHQNTRKPVLT